MVGVAATVVVVAVVSGGVAVVGAVSLMLMEALSMSKPFTFEACPIKTFLISVSFGTEKFTN